jgi:hypothetical protein
MSTTKPSEAARALRALIESCRRIRGTEAVVTQAALAAIEREDSALAAEAQDAEAPQPAPDPLSPEAFAGRTINGKPVLWLAWSGYQYAIGNCFEFTVKPCFTSGGICTVGWVRGRDFEHRHDLDDPARAGTTLYVGPPVDAAPNPWRDAIDDALVCAYLGTADSFASPREALAALIAWEQKGALDPAVSAEARALRDALRDERDDANAECVALRAECVRLRGEAAESEVVIGRLRGELTQAKRERDAARIDRVAARRDRDAALAKLAAVREALK